MTKIALALTLMVCGSTAAALTACSSDTSSSGTPDGGGPKDAATANDGSQADSAIDAPTESGGDASVDSGVDAPAGDANVDAPVEAGTDAGPVACNVPVIEPPNQARFGGSGNVTLTPTTGSSSVAFTLTGTGVVSDGGTITFELTFPPGVDAADAGGTTTYQFVDLMTATPLPPGKATLQVYAPDGSTWGTSQTGACVVQLTIASAAGGTVASASFHDVPLSAADAGASAQTTGSIQYPQ